MTHPGFHENSRGLVPCEIERDVNEDNNRYSNVGCSMQNSNTLDCLSDLTKKLLGDYPQFKKTPYSFADNYLFLNIYVHLQSVHQNIQFHKIVWQIN